MEQRAYTEIGKAIEDGRIAKKKTHEVGEVVAQQIRLAEEMGAEATRVVATAAIRDAENGKKAAKKIAEIAGVPVEILSEKAEGRLAFLGATKTLDHSVDGEVAVVDVGGGSSEVILGTMSGGVRKVHSFAIGSGILAEEHLKSDPPSPAEIRRLRDHIADFFAAVKIDQPEQAVAVGGSATSMRRLVGAVLEYETLERGIRVLTGDPAIDVAKKFELDTRRVRILPSGILILEQLSELLGRPLQIGNGGLREGVILDLISNGADHKIAA